MEKRILMKGNEAMAEGAILAGCRYYFGYPITPQNEVPAYMARRMPEVGGVFVQAESETASINMVYGASGAGARVMSTTSSPGYSLMQEGISYISGARLPCVLANVQRGGPGLGNINASQGDYFQAVKGGGHGDYRLIVLAPFSAQEMMDLTMLGFDLADQYRVPALILSDGIIGQMMEPVVLREARKEALPEKPWALTGAAGREKNIVRSLWLSENGVWDNNMLLQKTYAEITKNEVRFDNYHADGAKIVCIAYGSSARIVRGAVDIARAEGISVGLLRPVTLYPYPSLEIDRLIRAGAKAFLTVEQSAGQMVEDVRLAVNGRVPVEFYGELGGRQPREEQVLENIRVLARGIQE